MTKSKRLRDTLDPRILTAVIFLSVIEFEVFVLARGLVDAARHDAVFSLVLGSALLLLNAYILIKLASRFPRENPFQYLKTVWGGPLGTAIAAAYLLYWLLFLATLTKEFGLANRVLFLQETPKIVPLVLIGFGVVWLVTYGFTAVVRFFQLVFPGVLGLLLIASLLGIGELRLSNFLPVFSQGIVPILNGALVVLGGAQGLEVVLFAAPFLTSVKKGLKPALAGVGLVAFIAASQTIMAICLLGVPTVETLAWPGIAAISIIQLPGFPVERYELLLTLPWLVSIFTTLCIFGYLLMTGTAELFSIKGGKTLAAAIVVVAIVLAYVLPSQAWVHQLRLYIKWITLCFVTIIPTLTLLLAFVRRKGVPSHA